MKTAFEYKIEEQKVTNLRKIVKQQELQTEILKQILKELKRVGYKL